MGSSSRSLELKLMGCQGLQAFNFFQKLKVFAVVSLTSDKPGNNKHHNPQQQRTKTDTEGDKDPEWNQEMQFDLAAFTREDFDHLFLHIDLRYEFFGDKSLGDVRVPLADLVDGSACGERAAVARFVSYEIRNQEHKPNGSITFSYKVVDPLHGVGDSANASMENSFGRIDGYTAVNNSDQNHHHHQQNDDHDHDQNLQSQPDLGFSSYQYSSMESSGYRIQYPSMETPPYLPTSSGEGYMSYSRFDHHELQYQPPPPPPSYPFPPPPPPFHPSHPFPPPHELTRIGSDPFPPPQPPPHHHHHHHHHQHAAHEAVYPPPPSTGDQYEHSYGMYNSSNFNSDGTPRY